MKKLTHSIRLAILLGLSIGFPLVAFGAPSQIHRTEFADTVRSGLPYATSQTNIFDDGVGVLYDSVDYYYIAHAQNGVTLALTVSKQESLATVRIELTEQLSELETVLFMLDEMAKPTGTLWQLIDGLDPPFAPGAIKVNQARGQVKSAWAALGSLETSGNVQAFAFSLQTALELLITASADPGEVDPDGITEAIDELIQVARLVASHFLFAAEESCGPCSGGQPAEVCTAEAALQAGDDQLQSTSPDLGNVVEHFTNSAQESLDALGSCI